MNNISSLLRELAVRYNDPLLFVEDPISFPKAFAERGAGLKDIEVAAVVSAHLAWGRRSMIVRDCRRAFDEMEWKPYDYVMKGQWRCDQQSLHRTVSWSEMAGIFSRLRRWYEAHDSLEPLSIDDFRTEIYGQKPDPRSAAKKINMLRRWMVRRDGKVDLGLWRDTNPADLIIPLDVHVHRSAMTLGLTSRKGADRATALEITEALREVFPGDPCLGDFALFGFGVTGEGLK